MLLSTVDGDHGGAGLAGAGAGEGMGVDPLPRVLGDLDPGAGDPRVRPGEVPGQPQPEVLDLADPVPGEGEDGVLLRVGGQHVRVVAGQVGGGEVAAQRGRDGQVLDPVLRGGAVHRHHPDLGLAVLVGAQHDPHRSAPAVGGVRPRREQQRDVVVGGRLPDGERHGDPRVERVRRSGRRCGRSARGRRAAGRRRPSRQRPSASVTPAGPRPAARPGYRPPGGRWSRPGRAWTGSPVLLPRHQPCRPGHRSPARPGHPATSVSTRRRVISASWRVVSARSAAGSLPSRRRSSARISAGVPAGGADQEDVPEAVLVRAVGRGQLGPQLVVRGADGGLLAAGRGRLGRVARGALADPRVRGQRLLDLGPGEAQR